MFLLTSVMMLIIVRKGNEKEFFPPSILGVGGKEKNTFFVVKVEDCVVKQ